MNGDVRAVYIVLSHRDSEQVVRLMRAILASSPEARVLIAHDSRAEDFPFDVADERVEIFAHGLECDWGSWELVEATLHAMSRARERWNPQLITLISGQDYPLRSLPAWENQALSAAGWVGEATPLQYRPRWGRRTGDGDDRLTRYTFRWYPAPVRQRRVETPGALAAVAARLRRAVFVWLAPLIGVRYVSRGRGRYFGVRRRTPFSPGAPCYIGSQWLALRRDEIDALLDRHLAPGSRLWSFYQRSIIPDESALVTPLSWMRPPAQLPPVTLSHWDPAADTTVTWTLDDLDALLASGAPFCRKVDAESSSALMDALDELTSGAPRT